MERRRENINKIGEDRVRVNKERELKREKMGKGSPLPKFGDWDVNDPASSEGYTMIFNKARDEKKTGGKHVSPPIKDNSTYKDRAQLGKVHSGKWCCFRLPAHTEL